MQTAIRASLIASWVNTHDDGTPQPRAEVRHTPTCRAPYCVVIRSTEYRADGSRLVVVDHAWSTAEARAILGY